MPPIYVLANHPIKFFYRMSKTILANGIKYGDLIECRNTFSELKNVEETISTQKAHDIFIDIFGEKRFSWAKQVTFIEPIREEDILTNETIYHYKCLPKSEKRDSYFGRLIGECGGFNRNQFNQMTKRLKEGKNSKTCQMVVFKETDIFNSMAQPCCISINCAPRKGKLNITANFRSMAISKAGYADAQAVWEMGLYLAKECELELDSVGIFAHSSHLRGKDQEMKKDQEIH